MIRTIKIMFLLVCAQATMMYSMLDKDRTTEIINLVDKNEVSSVIKILNQVLPGINQEQYRPFLGQIVQKILWRAICNEGQGILSTDDLNAVRTLLFHDVKPNNCCYHPKDPTPHTLLMSCAEKNAILCAKSHLVLPLR